MTQNHDIFAELYLPKESGEQYQSLQETRQVQHSTLSCISTFEMRLTSKSAKYDHGTIRSILQSTFFSTVSFIIENESGTPQPFSAPMTAVAGRYDASNVSVSMQETKQQDHHEQTLSENQGFDVYLHGNSAMLLNQMAKTNGCVGVVISSTKG